MLKLIFNLILPVLLTFLFMVYLVFNSQQSTYRLTDEVRREAPGKFLKLEHGYVHYRLEGIEDAPLIVFIHGGGVTGMEVWSQNMSYFVDKGYRVLAFDLYGRGYSDRPKVTHSPPLFRDQLTQILDHLHLSDESIHLVALSMGAIVAMDYYHSHPQQVKKMVLIDPQASGHFKSSPLLSVPLVKDFLMTVYWYPRAIANQEKEFVNKDLFGIYAKRLEYFMSFKGYKHTNHSTWMNMLNQNKLDLVSETDIPDLFLIYGDQDPYFRESQQDLYLAKFPFIKTKKIADAGHMPQFEKPHEVNQAIHEFLANEGSSTRITTSR